MSVGGLDWPGLMRAGLFRLGLRPDQFWALTPAELAVMTGMEAVVPPLDRARLEEMAARWPDKRGDEEERDGEWFGGSE